MNLETTILIGILLGSLPVISFFLQRFFSKLERNKKVLFSKFIPVVYLDWLFVPFNLIWPFVVIFNKYILLLFLLVFVGNLVFSRIWIKVHLKERNPIGLYNLKTKNLTIVGKVHSIYAQIQALLILSFIFFSSQNWISLVSLFFFFLYVCAGPFSSKAIHGNFILADKIFIGFCWLGIVIKLFLYFN